MAVASTRKNGFYREPIALFMTGHHKAKLALLSWIVACTLCQL
jgi:hypothetical protein